MAQQTDNPGGIRTLFRKARAAVTAPAPPKKSKRGGEDERRFFKAIRARERENARASLFQSNTLLWLDLWRGNAGNPAYALNTGPDHPLQQGPINPLAPRL